MAARNMLWLLHSLCLKICLFRPVRFIHSGYLYSAQGLYVAARVGFERATFRMQATEPQRPTDGYATIVGELLYKCSLT